MKKQLLLGSVTALMLSSGLHANWDGNYAEWDNNGYYEYDECCSEGKLLVDAEFLWWTPGTYFPFANNTFVNDGNAVSSPSAPFPSVTDTVIEPYVRISEKWSPGVRIGLGWESADCDWQIWGRWTGYSNYARRHITSTPPAAVGGVASSNFGFLQPAIGSDIFENGATGTSATGTYKLNYNVADLVFARSFQPDCNLSLTPYAGVRASFILQRQRVFFDGATTTTTLTGVTASLPASSKFTEELWGVGPRIGLGAVWGDWCGISLIGNISGAILYGRLEEYARTSNTSFGFDTGIDAEAITTSVLRTRDRYNLIMPNLQVQLGFGYKLDFNCDLNSIDVYALWEGNYYWGASNVFLFERGLGLNGLTTGIAFSW